MGRYKDPCEVSLPGFGIGMINDELHIERLKRAVIYSMKKYACPAVR